MVKNNAENEKEQDQSPTELELNLQAKIKELEDKLTASAAANEESQKALIRMNALEVALEELKTQKAAEVPVKAQSSNLVLICNSKVRTFTVSPEKVLKIYRGTKEGNILRDRVLTITPGSVLEVTPELAEFLLSYKKDFSRYDVPLS